MKTRRAAVYCDCDASTITRAVAAGELRAAGKRGRSLVFERSALDEWMRGTADLEVTPIATAPSKPQSTIASRHTTPRETSLARIRLIVGGAR